MATPDRFVGDVGPSAAIASSRTGVPTSVILAQWGIETGWGTSQAFVQGNNFAGIMGAGGPVSYPDRPSGLAAYIATLLHGDYNAVRTAGDPTAAAVALGDSPWDAGHYGGHGADLLSVIGTNNLTSYDTTPSPAAPGDPGIVSGGTPKASPAKFNPFNPFDPTGLADTVISRLADAVRKPLLVAVAVAGGGALIVLGGWRAASPTLRPVIDKAKTAAGDAAKAAAVA